MLANSLVCAVGASAPNQSQDVLIVQNCFIQQLSCNPQLKNRLIRKSAQLGEQLPAEGNELELFLSTPANDALSIAVLTALIKSWQVEVMNFSRPDGKIEPNGPTWRSINGNVASVQRIQPQVGAVASPSAVAPVAAREGSYALFKQGDYQQPLFNSSQTIARKGCYLCTLVMAATAIGSRTPAWAQAGIQVLPEKLTPTMGNQIAIRTGSCVGADIKAEQLARHLGMRFKPYAQGSTRSYPNHLALVSSDISAIDGHLASGNPVAAGVKYNSDSSRHAQHWVLIVSRTTDGKYIALDPGIGKKITLTKDVSQSYRNQISHNEGMILFGDKSNPAGHPTQYGVMTIILLSSL
ncbi:MAG TPA: hypothetical protein VFM46_06730 [Pseudomonadales bacterium]|nr:hypothetical protein [Pseudomonadales bacterium]